MEGKIIALWLIAGATVHAGILTINSTAPVSNDPVSYAGTGAGTNIKNDGLTRGNTFLMGDAGGVNTQWSLNQLTVQKRGAFTAINANDTVKLWIFEWNGTDGNDISSWTNGNGVADSDPLNGTGVGNVLVDGEVFALPASIAADDYLHFDYNASPLVLDENTAYGFLIQYGTDGSATADSINFGLYNGNPGTYADGQLLGVTYSGTPANNFVATQDMAFWVNAEAIPEPATIGLIAGMGVSVLFIRRRFMM